MKDSEHGFYSKPVKEQRRIQIGIATVAILVNLVLGAASLSIGAYPLPMLFIAVTLSVVAPFFDVPSMKKKGKLIYYSPLFVAEEEKNGVIQIHGGTLLDYVFAVDRSLNGKQRTIQVLMGYIAGMLNLIESHRDRDFSEIRIRGTSYFINENTARRIGLQSTERSAVQTIILLYNYVNLTITHSIARATLSFPRMRNISTFEGRLSDVARNSKSLIRLRDKLASRSYTK